MNNLVVKYKYNYDIENIRRTKESRAPQNQRIAYVGRTQAGTYITADNALCLSAVWACIRYLSESIAKLPWTLRRETDEGFEELRGTPLNRMLKYRASDDYSSFQFRETLMNWTLRYGNGYAEIERDNLGRAIAMHPIHPYRVQVYRDIETQEIYYIVTNETGGRVIIDRNDMFHLRGFGEGVVGLNVMQYAAQSLGWAKAVQLFGAGFFGNGSNMTGIITMKKPMSEEGLKHLREEFDRLYSGPSNSNKTAVLDNEMSYQGISIEPEKGQFIETNQHLTEEICRWFGVPPHKIYHLLRSTFSNIEHQSIEVVVDSLTPWARRFEDEANYKLVLARSDTITTRMNFDALLEGDSASRVSYYNTMRNMGAISVNEIRMREGMNGIGEPGDMYVTQSQYVPLDQIGQEPAPEVPLLPAPEESEELEQEEVTAYIELMHDLKDFV